MSAYKKIECEIVDKDCLLEALKLLDLDPNLYDVPEQLRGYMGDLRNEKAHIIIRKEKLDKMYTGLSNDIGFLWDEINQKYEFICSDYDKSKKMDLRIIQAYAKVVLEQALEKNGFKIKVNISEDVLRSRQLQDIEFSAKKLI